VTEDSEFHISYLCRGADKSLARPGRRQATATEDFEFHVFYLCRGADKSLARPTSQYILFDCENISFDASLVIYVNSTNILPIKITQEC
jgi:hypothetical protein